MATHKGQRTARRRKPRDVSASVIQDLAERLENRLGKTGYLDEAEVQTILNIHKTLAEAAHSDAEAEALINLTVADGLHIHKEIEEELRRRELAGEVIEMEALPDGIIPAASENPQGSGTGGHREPDPVPGREQAGDVAEGKPEAHDPAARPAVDVRAGSPGDAANDPEGEAGAASPANGAVKRA